VPGNRTHGQICFPLAPVLYEIATDLESINWGHLERVLTDSRQAGLAI
jgi:hypothetical protein